MNDSNTLMTQGSLAGCVAVGIVIGATYADWDQRTSLLVHRSILTHGWLIPATLCCGLFLLPSRTWFHRFRAFLIGLSSASALHLCFDLFPKAWFGHALIHIPGYGRTSAWFSWLWIAGSSVGLLLLTLFLIKHTVELVLTVAGVIYTIQVHTHEEYLKPLFVFVLMIGLVAWIPYKIPRFNHIFHHKEKLP